MSITHPDGRIGLHWAPKPFHVTFMLHASEMWPLTTVVCQYNWAKMFLDDEALPLFEISVLALRVRLSMKQYAQTFEIMHKVSITLRNRRTFSLIIGTYHGVLGNLFVNIHIQSAL